MKTQKLTLLTTLVMLILLGAVLLQIAPAVNTSRSNEPIPYIYYYSDLLHAFVVERADGTDSRLLGQGLMQDYNSISSVHWSPSGEWLAWVYYDRYGSGVSAKFAGLISTNGQQISHLLDDATDVFLMQWADDKDWLLVGFQGRYLEATTTIRVIDVANQYIVTEIQYDGNQMLDPPNYYYPLPSAWSDDNQSVYFVFSQFFGAVITRIKLNGQIEQWFFDLEDPLLAFNYERMMAHRWQWRDGEFWEDWYIRDLTTEEEYIFATYPSDEASENIDYDLFWNEQRTYAIVTEKQCEAEPYRNCQATARYILDWANRQHYLFDEAYQLADYKQYPYPPSSLWSPNGRFLLLEDESRNLFVLNTESREIDSTALINNVNWQWSSDDSLILIDTNEDREAHLYRFNPDTNQASSADLSYPAQIENYSPETNLIAYIQQNVLVENLTTGEQFSFPRHSRTTWAGPVTRYIWDENSEWFFSGSNTSIAGGCCSTSAIMIHHLSEPTGRELSHCYEVDTCAGFLPEHVLPHLARGQSNSFTPLPIQTLLHDRTVQGVAWSPDGSQVLTYSYEWNIETVISIWDMREEQAQMRQSFSSTLGCNVSSTTSCQIFWLDENTIAFTGRQENNQTFLETIDLSTGETTTEEYAFPTQNALLSPNQDYELIYEGEYTEGLADLLEVSTGRLIFANFDFGYRVRQFDYQPQTALLVGSTVFDRGSLWNAATGEKIADLNWTGYTASFSPDGRLLAVAGSDFVTIWDMSSYIETSD